MPVSLSALRAWLNGKRSVSGVVIRDRRWIVTDAWCARHAAAARGIRFHNACAMARRYTYRNEI
jgi:hypothetical protein